MPPRSSDQVSSPRATSAVVSGVASICSNSFSYFSLKKKLNVESRSAPFIAEAASMPGATNSAYGMTSPLNSNPDTSCPTPTPIENR